MKRFTIIFSILLTLGFAGALVGVGLSEDFVEPGSGLVGEGEDPNAPIWSMTLDEVLAELEGQGLIDTSGQISLAAGGLCTDAVKVSNGAEFYWWDLDNLDESSGEYAAYKSLKEEGFINLYGNGSIISPVSNGPFALLLSLCEGDVDALDKAFRAVGQTGGASAEDRNAPVWNMTMDDFLTYLVEEGIIPSVDDAHSMATGVATEGYGYDGASFYWWDVDNLVEGSAEEIAYQSAAADGIIDIYGSGTIVPFTINGPFALGTAYYNGDVDALVDAFEEFGRK